MNAVIDQKGKFAWRVIASHMIGYSFAGLFAVLFMNYEYLYSIPPLSYFMRQLDDPLVSIGPLLQVFRGAILAFVLWFFRKTLLQEKNGFLKIVLLILGLSYISTIGPVLGSFEGYVYTTFPIKYHLLGIPETIIYAGIFSGILSFWYKKEPKWLNVISIIMIVIISLVNLLGLLSAMKML